eukprot:CAMPEP_0117433296 /NCGR_PEP_ID=MMETSP0758-20121206/12684_1 /TAXON_ID=63605 /ORGANISM="Percolomonas cosmopolitus, Strain AE-1 (ATCC 50343)" /LENGTH=109 /DNA_ID=CAMNT_0005223871 /DNA_START=283 /DNA_END=612 /DNA_ORIENTATION=+
MEVVMPKASVFTSSPKKNHVELNDDSDSFMSDYGSVGQASLYEKPYILDPFTHQQEESPSKVEEQTKGEATAKWEHIFNLQQFGVKGKINSIHKIGNYMYILVVRKLNI